MKFKKLWLSIREKRLVLLLLNSFCRLLEPFSKLSQKINQKRAYSEFQGGKRPKIKWLSVELTSFCNLNCRYCILDNSRPKGFMSINLFKKILKEIRGQKILVEQMSIFNAGETLLHPKLEQFLKLLAEEKQTNKNFPRVGLTTNGVLMTKKNQRIILKSKAVDDVCFSLDGGNKKDFEFIRRGAKWEKVLENANDFINLKNQLGKEVKVGVRSILIKKPNYSPEFRELIKKLDHYWPIKPHDWDGSKKFADLEIKKEPRRSFCNFILRNLAILWDGRVSPCCNDQNGRGIIGNFKKQSIRQIYFCQARKTMIENMARGQRQKIPLCQNCSL